MSMNSNTRRTRGSGACRLNEVFEVHQLIFEKKMREDLMLGLTTVTIQPGDEDIVGIRQTLPCERSFLIVAAVTGNGKRFGVQTNDIILRPVSGVGGQEAWRSMEQTQLTAEAAHYFDRNMYTLYVARRNPQGAVARQSISLTGPTPRDDDSEQTCNTTDDISAYEDSEASVPVAYKRAATAVTPPSATSRTGARKNAKAERHSKQRLIGTIVPSSRFRRGYFRNGSRASTQASPAATTQRNRVAMDDPFATLRAKIMKENKSARAACIELRRRVYNLENAYHNVEHRLQPAIGALKSALNDKDDDKSDNEGDDKSDDQSIFDLPHEIMIPTFDGNRVNAFSLLAPFVDKVRAQTRAFLVENERLALRKERLEASVLELQEDFESLLEKVKCSRRETRHEEE